MSTTYEPKLRLNTTQRRVFFQTGRGIALTLLLVWSLFPIYWIIASSFKSRLQNLSDTPLFLFQPSFDAYDRIFNSPSRGVLKELINSVVVTTGSTILSVGLAALAGYALARLIFPEKRYVLNLILASRLLPPVSAIIPLFILYSNLGLTDTKLGLILAYSALNAPFAAWLLKSFFENVPLELEEAARIDGCGEYRAFATITLRLALPGIVATAIIVGSLAWNEFLFAFMLTSTDSATLPLSLAELRSGEQVPWQDLGARATLLIIPPLVFGIWSQKYLVKGLTAGAVK